MIDYSLNKLYEAADISKQAVWQHFQREAAQLELIEELIGRVEQRRAEHPGEGLTKLYWQLTPEEIGRDKFCRIFGQLGYHLKRPNNPVRTTIPAHKVFSNRIEGRVVSARNQVWESDITYIQVGERHYYLTFIIDAYTRRVIGWAASDSLRADANIEALQMALDRFPEAELQGCVHHSDRGTQYTDSRYLKLLRSHGLAISMGRKATDNAFAERINGVIKNEYLIPWGPSSFRQLKKLTKKAVSDYNTKRHHGALDKCSPIDYERRCQELSADKRKIEVIRSENTPKFLKSALEGGLQGLLDSIKEHPYCPIS
jgi:AcrR family transcriptional regulator